jgi:hypothetical protein
MASFTILEPMSTGDVIDRAVRLYRRNFAQLVAIAAVPTLIGYVVSLMFWYGYTSLLTGATGSRALPVSAILMLSLGGLGYPIWIYVLLLTISGLSRVVGDHLMLGEPITFRGCWTAVKRRIGAITLMGLILVALMFVAYFAVAFVVVAAALGVGLMAGAITSIGLPPWVAGVMLTVLVIIVVALALLLILLIVARVVFLPQIVMIEGESAGNALGRAIRLGKGNWYRVAGIILFTYFVSLSMIAALALPVAVGLYLAGVLTTEFLFSPTWSILYTSFRDMSGLLTLPIWVVSFTLLYFDSRVRKEAYDVDLLAREINPGFYWQPPVQTSAFGYPISAPSGRGRAWVQTSPLGLAGYRPASPRTDSSLQPEPAEQAPGESQELRDRFERAARSLTEREERPTQAAAGLSDSDSSTCKGCGARLVPGARFCINCGNATST